jgi:hypothetical protein
MAIMRLADRIENGLHPKVRVEVAGKIAFKKFSALVDTGFDLDVALHHNEAAKLGLKADDFVWVRYANDKRTFAKIIFPAAKPTSLPARDYPRQNRERL